MNASVLRMKQIWQRQHIAWLCQICLIRWKPAFIDSNYRICFIRSIRCWNKRYDCCWWQITFVNERGMDVDEMRSMRDIMYEFSWQQHASYFAYSPTKRPMVANSLKINHFSNCADYQYITSKHLHQGPAFRAFFEPKHCHEGRISMLLHAWTMQIVSQNNASTTNKIEMFKLKLKFSGSKTSCLLPVCLLIFSIWCISKCRFRGIKQTKYWTIY